MHVAIVGAGPAGAWAALTLARAGARVTLFDHTHPREKPCGGGLTGRAVELIVHALGSFPVPAVPIAAARFERAMASPSEPARGSRDIATMALVDRGLSAESSLVVASRRALDGALLEAAVRSGAVHVAERVVDLDGLVNGPAGRTGVCLCTRAGATYRADMVLGADGANSFVRRRVAGAFSRRQISIGAGYFVPGVRSSDIVIRWMAEPAGYLWSFPRVDHLAVGACSQADDTAGAEALKRHAAGWIAAANLAKTGARLESYSWPIPSLAVRDFSNFAVAGDRWMLLGDAAGLVDPLTREGIFYALASGEMAARAIVENGGTAAASYRERLSDTIVPELYRAAQLKRGFFDARFSRVVIRALTESAAVRSVIVDLVGGRQPYIGLRRRLLGTLEFGLAMRTGMRWAR